LHEFGVELVLADDLTETVTHLGSRAIPVPVSTSAEMRTLGRELLDWSRNRADFLDRADADAIRLSQSSIHGARFSDAHLRAADERGNVGGIRVAVTYKAGGTLGREDRRFKDEAIRRRITQRI